VAAAAAAAAAAASLPECYVLRCLLCAAENVLALAVDVEARIARLAELNLRICKARARLTTENAMLPDCMMQMGQTVSRSQW
jgi:hypothetical protein